MSSSYIFNFLFVRLIGTPRVEYSLCHLGHADRMTRVSRPSGWSALAVAEPGTTGGWNAGSRASATWTSTFATELIIGESLFGAILSSTIQNCQKAFEKYNVTICFVYYFIFNLIFNASRINHFYIQFIPFKLQQ